MSRDRVTSLDEDVTPRSAAKSKRRYNLRRLNELPYHLVRCRRTDQLLDEVTCASSRIHDHLVHFVEMLQL